MESMSASLKAAGHDVRIAASRILQAQAQLGIARGNQLPTAGVILATLIANWFNHLGITYMPPGQANPVPLVVLTQGVGKLLFSVWFGLMLMATIAAIIPASRAARMLVVDALRHV